MKNKFVNLMCLTLCIVLLAGCASNKPANTPTPEPVAVAPAPNPRMSDEQIEAMLGNVRLGVTVATLATLNIAAKDAADRSNKAKIVVGIADIFSKLANGQVESPDKVQALVRSFVPDKKHWATLGTQIVTVGYSYAYPKFKNDTALFRKTVEAISTALSDAAAPYILE